MNISKKINELEKLTKGEFYSILSEFFNDLEKEVAMINDMVINQLDNPASLDNINVNAKNIMKSCNIHLKELITIIDKKISDCAFGYVNSTNEFNLFIKRRMFLINKYASYFQMIKDELLSDLISDMLSFEEDNQIEEDNVEETNINENIISLNNNSNSQLNKKYLIQKIFNYKNLELLAINNGYEYKWTNGSHKIFEHPITRKIIVIPTHTLGLGLSVKIQKQIYKNKEVI